MFKGPFTSVLKGNKKVIRYRGNKIYKQVDDISKKKITQRMLSGRLDSVVKNPLFFHLHNIDNTIFFSAVDFFRNIGADWCNLPLTTLMISSPGGVYTGKKLNYTTDALPIELKWFDNKRRIFLSESSQFYLELRLLIKEIDKVFSIYNSFRKEPSDFSHLSEFQHIEFEGKVDFEENVKIFLDLLGVITKNLVSRNREDLLYFLSDKEIVELEDSFSGDKIKRLTLKEALKLLYSDTNNEVYKDFSLENFGAWEEIRLSEIVGAHVILTEFPILQIPFYHDVQSDSKSNVARNADLILRGYRETIGAGTRIENPNVLAKKAKVFNLPQEDYNPYLKTRTYSNYKKTSGFGLGWQRYAQWLLKLPYIWEAIHIPRTEHLPKP